MKNYCFLLLSIFVISCGEKSNQQNSTAKSVGLDLNKITFTENPLEILKGKIDSSKNAQEEYVKKGFSEAFDYPVGHKFEPWNGKDSFYGKAYYSNTTESIAHIDDLYFDKIAFLTHQNKTVAVLATIELFSDSAYNHLVKKFNQEYGAPSFNPQTDQDVFYEWTGKDRYIQLDHYKSRSVSVSSDKPMEMKETFVIELLIFNKDAGLAIEKIQKDNYAKTKSYKVMQGDFKLYRQDPAKNLELANELLAEKFK